MKKIILFVVICWWLANANIEAQFGGGTGSQSNPYQIHTKKHLEELSDSIIFAVTPQWTKMKYVKLMNNITDTLTTPIGSSGSPFAGYFDGNNHFIIVNLDFPDSNFIGLFRFLHYGTISNLIVKGFVKGDSRVGGITPYTMGIIDNTFGHIKNCINLATVEGNSRVGGILGNGFFSFSVLNCTNLGSVKGNSDVGGIVGWSFSNVGCITGNRTAQINNCYWDEQMCPPDDYDIDLLENN